MLRPMYLLVLVFTASFALPQTPNSPISRFFVHPNARNNGPIPRIIGGQEAQPHQFPYLVGLYVNFAYGTNFCGGSLVSADYVLTAAHCVLGEDGSRALSVDLVFGAHVINASEATQVRQTSTEYIIHPDWNRDRLINDIAVIKLPQSIVENDYIKIVSIARGLGTFSGENGVVAGWGVTSNNQDGLTPTLRYLIGDILSNDDCRNIEPYASVIQSTHLCLSGVAGAVNVGTCNGDSGGPLAVDGIQVGIVSFGYNDCEAGKPSVFTRVTEFLGWIRANSNVAV